MSKTGKRNIVHWAGLPLGLVFFLPGCPNKPTRPLANDVVFGAEAGEGLGCYYHRSYYSHLPMFKAGAYHLPGSLDVAEPYQKASSTALSSPSPPK